MMARCLSSNGSSRNSPALAYVRLTTSPSHRFLGRLLPARHKLSVCEGRLELLDELPRNRVVIDASVANDHAQRIGMRAERHIPEREDDTTVGVAELRVGCVMNTVNLRSDSEAVHEGGNSASDV